MPNSAPKSIALPTRREFAWALAILLGGALLGLAVNAVSPKGFDFWLAAGLRNSPAPAVEEP